MDQALNQNNKLTKFRDKVKAAGTMSVELWPHPFPTGLVRTVWGPCCKFLRLLGCALREQKKATAIIDSLNTLYDELTSMQAEAKVNGIDHKQLILNKAMHA